MSNQKPYTAEEFAGIVKAAAWCVGAVAADHARRGLEGAAAWISARQRRCLVEALAGLVWVQARRDQNTFGWTSDDTVGAGLGGSR